LNQLAKETGFTERKSKLNGSLFLDLLVFNSENLKSQSLNDLSIILKDKHGVEIKKQSLHERFNANALHFLKGALEKMLQKQLAFKRFPGLERFKRILVKDSTCFQIDPSLALNFPGSGGSGSKAAIRIQFEYDLLSGRINDLSINPFNQQDAKNSITTMELTNEGDLIIRDLAYMSIKALTGIIKRNAYYLCRANPSVKIYEKIDGVDKEMNFRTLRKHMNKNGISSMEKKVYLGAEKFKTRLIVYLMPEREVEKRLRNAYKINKKKGRKNLPTKEYLARAHFNLFITNASKDQISTKMVWPVYTLRWQIELIFKIWKTICGIEKVKKVQKNRLECYLYAKLILIVLGWRIIWKTAQNLFRMENKSLSYYKAFKTLLWEKLYDMRRVFLLEKNNMKELMNHFYNISKTNHLLEKKQQKERSFDILLSFATI
jgi:hypothetical protein